MNPCIFCAKPSYVRSRLCRECEEMIADIHFDRQGEMRFASARKEAEPAR